MARIIIRGGTVLHGPADTGHFAPADVLVEDGRIDRIAPAVEATDADVVDATGTSVLPGYVDAHHHL